MVGARHHSAMSQQKQNQTQLLFADHSTIGSPQSRHIGLVSLMCTAMKLKPFIELCLLLAPCPFERLGIPFVDVHVPSAGVEPASLAGPEFESGASACSAMRANFFR